MLFVTGSLLPPLCNAVNVADSTAIVTTDYTEFGETGKPGLNTLERQVLGPLCGYCIACTSPEIPSALVSRRMGELATDDGARCLAFSVLKDYSMRDPPNCLVERLNADLTFAGLLLLAKLLHANYVERLQHSSATVIKEHRLARNSIEMHRAFVDLVDAFSASSNEIVYSVSEKITAARGMKLVDCARQGGPMSSSIDYALLTIAKDCCGDRELFSEFSSLLDYWFEKYERFKQRFNIIAGYMRTVTQPGNFSRARLRAFRKYVLVRVTSKDEPEYLELLRTIFTQKGLKTSVYNFIMKHESATISLHFMLHYVDYLLGTGLTPYTTIKNIWRNFLRNAPSFLRRRAMLEKSPELFNKLPPWFLQEVFGYLEAHPAGYFEREETMHSFMSIMDYRCFFAILRTIEDSAQQTALMDFMLSYLNERAVFAYFNEAKAVACLKTTSLARRSLAIKLFEALRTLNATNQAMSNNAEASPSAVTMYCGV
ncbi:hypothetical protein PAPHI01_1124 [Pancytospora philotis]|nr:hypothetical protein PAPHI01_1124 [Pancytospora philotis]